MTHLDGETSTAVAEPEQDRATEAIGCDETTGATFPLPPGRALLDAALDAGVELAHGCRHGACGACAVEVVEGLENCEARDPIEADSACRFRLAPEVRLACRTRARGCVTFRPY